MTRRPIRPLRLRRVLQRLRPRRHRRVIAAAMSLAFVVSVTGCDSMHPGAAAVVGDTTIQESELDHFVDALCVSNSVAASQGGAPTDQAATRDLRRTILN